MGTDKTTLLPLKVKLSYTFGYFGKNVFILLGSYFLLYFYTDIIQIPAASATVILAVARIWDAVNDPMMGVLVDRTKSKEGKCRFWLKYFSIPAGIIIAISFFVPALSMQGKITWIAITYILQGMATTMVTVPSNALLARITESREDRASIGQFNGIVSSICNFTVPALTLPLISILGGGNSQNGFAILALLLGTLFAVSLLVMYWGAKGYEPSYEEECEVSKLSGDPMKKISIPTMLKNLFSNKYTMLVSIAYMAFLLLNGIMGTTLVYYFTYNLKQVDLLGIYSALITVGSIIPIFLMRLILKKLGNAKACFIGVFITGLACLLRLVTKDSILPLTIASWFFMGFGSGMMNQHIFQSILDSVTYGKLKNNTDGSGMIMSFFTFAQKLGQALGSIVAGGLLAIVPYIPKATVQEDSVLKLFFTENITIPLIVSIFTGIIFLSVAKLEKELFTMQSEIQ